MLSFIISPIVPIYLPTFYLPIMACATNDMKLLINFLHISTRGLGTHKIRIQHYMYPMFSISLTNRKGGNSKINTATHTTCSLYFHVQLLIYQMNWTISINDGTVTVALPIHTIVQETGVNENRSTRAPSSDIA